MRSGAPLPWCSRKRPVFVFLDIVLETDSRPLSRGRGLKRRRRERDRRRESWGRVIGGPPLPPSGRSAQAIRAKSPACVKTCKHVHTLSRYCACVLPWNRACVLMCWRTGKGLNMTVMIGLVSQKGGVGKSTISRLVAREYAAAGWTVKIVDLDISQGTNTDWKQRREQNALQPEVAVEPFRTVAQAMKVASLYDLMVFDGPPHSMAGTLEIARASDVVVLPTGLSLDDLKPTILLAHELVDAGISADKLAVGLCRVGDRENEIEEARGYARKAGYRTLNGALPEKTAYRRASDEGRAASEVTFPTLRVKAEELAQSIIDLVSERPKQDVA